MMLKSLSLALFGCQMMAAHTLFTTLFVNDVSQGDGTCVRMPRNPSTATAPITDLASEEMMCGKCANHEDKRMELKINRL